MKKDINNIISNFERDSIYLNNQKSYITKNQFIEMINNLDFIAIEKANIHFITGFVNKINDKNEYITNTRGFDFDIY